MPSGSSASTSSRTSSADPDSHVETEVEGGSMKIRSILQDVDFGEDAAEDDPNLEAYFVETSAFLDLVRDHADVVLGPKGSGKTAISTTLCNPRVDIEQLGDTDRVA